MEFITRTLRIKFTLVATLSVLFLGMILGVYADAIVAAALSVQIDLHVDVPLYALRAIWVAILASAIFIAAVLAYRGTLMPRGD